MAPEPSVTAQEILAALRKASPEELISIRRLLTMGKNAERAADAPREPFYSRGETQREAELKAKQVATQIWAATVGKQHGIKLPEPDPEIERQLDWIDGIDWSN